MDPTATVTVTAAAGGGAEGVARAALAPNVRDGASVRDVFSRAVDIESPPRKTLLRMLGEYTSEPKEQYTLLHLCRCACVWVVCGCVWRGGCL